ncbi:HlyD family efflux transporter periplasmic adaptor subunit [Galbibacter sp. EGI 63066]|uniref:HlyD family secretion protein n=1 Tax=Galbibacter sp. EGI 63066 TaxID=2993559 RepID=UPI0022491DE1|nr:HlyD family efflux transporter periplasmic adaptor subunit [Galbibacter sp. EGI 63066]MCX2678901.1 HlyD family efflux transporter periplasmic adaptor subunit [Galbibacter sp. EGI 63066]
MKQLFPKEVIESTSIAHAFKHRTRSKIVYGIILISILTALILLPFIHVTVYTSARGIIKPDKERVAVNTINSGKVVYANIQPNKQVVKGDTLLVIDNAVIDEKIDLATYQIETLKEQQSDLNYLIRSNNIRLNEITSPKYQREVIQYREKRNELQTRLKKTKIDYQRNKTLYDKGVIAQAEFEEVQLQYDLSVNSLYQHKKQQLNTWQANLTEIENRLEEIENSKKQLSENKKLYVITAPINGVLMNTQGIEPGSYLQAGMGIAEISPMSDLLAECYVSPVDIGMIKPENEINFQIDAFNYNQWGLATGKIIEMGKDIEVIDNQAVFKIRCKLAEPYLELKNGVKGTLSKGMTFNARFQLTERTLYQLLYDKLDDWLNPSLKENKENI